MLLRCPCHVASSSPASQPCIEISALLNPAVLLCCCLACRREQEEREARKEAGLPPPPEELPPMRGSHDSGDPFTTNLFIGNLAPDVDEQVRWAQREGRACGRMVARAWHVCMLPDC